MKKIYLLIILALFQLSLQAQDIKGENIIVLKGGVTVIRFNAEVTKYSLGEKEDYNIRVEDGDAIYIQSKPSASNPKSTNLIVKEGGRNHMFIIEFKEKGDFNSTSYNYSNLKELKKLVGKKSISTNDIVKNEVKEKEVEEIKPEKETKSAKKLREEKERQLAKEREESEALEQKIASEKAKQDELEKQLDQEKKEKESKLAKEKIDKSEKERQKLQELKEQQEEARIATEEKKKQEDLDKKIALEKKKKADLTAKLEAQRKAQEEKEEKERKLQEDRIAKEESNLALAKTQKEKNDLNAKLLAEKKQSEALEKKLAAERLKRDANEKALALETQKREQKEAALAKEQKASEAKEQKLALERKKREEADRKIKEAKEKREEQERIAQEEREKYVPPPAEIDIRKKFPTVNFNEPPQGQYFDGMFYGDTTAYYKAAQSYLVQKEDAKFKNAGTEMDNIRVQLCNINFSGKAAYVRFKIENKTNEYFILGATMLKILEAESGKKYQLNPYYISSFPIIEANSSAYVVYVMKPEQNISPESFVIMSIRERQSNKKFELNFPGNFYTDALKQVEK